MEIESDKILTERIMAVTLEINENYPELNKYLSETADANSTEKNPDVNKRNLKAYYDTLIDIVKKYKQNQNPK